MRQLRLRPWTHSIDLSERGYSNQRKYFYFSAAMRPRMAIIGTHVWLQQPEQPHLTSKILEIIQLTLYHIENLGPHYRHFLLC